MSKCAICGVRKPKRSCPGVNGDICPQCCGQEREVTVNCPITCGYLREAREHEKTVPVLAKDVPNQDVPVTESFLRSHEMLLLVTSQLLLLGAVENAETVDADVREAIASLIKTYRTMQSGLIYDSVPANPFAATIYRSFQTKLAEFQQRIQERAGAGEGFRDAEVLGVLVFLERVAMDQNNGRPKCHRFLEFLMAQFPQVPEGAQPPAAEEPPSSLIIP